MKKHSMLLAAAGVALGLAVAQPLVAAQPPPPDYYPMKVGYWWKYRVGNLAGAPSETTDKVVQSDDKRWLMMETDAGTASNPVTFFEYYTKPIGWVMWRAEKWQDNRVEFHPDRKLLENPPVKGHTWSWSGKGMRDVSIEEKVTVVGPESVTVPAGTFRCMHVHFDITQGGQPTTKDEWFANWVGFVKGGDFSQGGTELVDYSFRKK